MMNKTNALAARPVATGGDLPRLPWPAAGLLPAACRRQRRVLVACGGLRWPAVEACGGPPWPAVACGDQLWPPAVVASAVASAVASVVPCGGLVVALCPAECVCGAPARGLSRACLEPASSLL